MAQAAATDTASPSGTTASDPSTEEICTRPNSSPPGMAHA